MIYSADGSAALTLSSNFAVGVENTGGSVRKIKNFTTPSWHFSAKAELKAACRASFKIAIPAMADGNIYAEIGVKSTPDVEVYSDGRKPVMCILVCDGGVFAQCRRAVGGKGYHIHL